MRACEFSFPSLPLPFFASVLWQSSSSSLSHGFKGLRISRGVRRSGGGLSSALTLFFRDGLLSTFLSLSLPHTRAHTHTHTHTHMYSYRFLAFFCSTLSHTNTHRDTHTQFSLPLSHSHPLSHRNALLRHSTPPPLLPPYGPIAGCSSRALSAWP